MCVIHTYKKLTECIILDSWSLDELSSSTNLPETQLRDILSFWIRKSVVCISEGENRYAIAEHHQNQNRGLESSHLESSMADHQEEESAAAELMPLVPFITGMPFCLW